jgi:HD-like signal output (HDOD) protein
MTIVIASAEHQTLRFRALASLATLPPFSPILNRLIATLSRDDVSFVRIADLIEKDTVLAGNVLKLVNSALYGRRATINSVRHAVSLLGMNKLRNATLGMSVTRMWNQVRTPAGWSMAKFNLHAVATAMLSDLLAQELQVEYGEGAFAAGLFHDLGRLLIALALPDEHLQITIMCSGGHISRSDCEMEALGFTHAQLSADALAQWNLPEMISTAVLDHHSAPPAENNELFSLGYIVSVADEIVNTMGYSIDAKNTTSLLAALSIEALLDSGNKEHIPRLESLHLSDPKALLQNFVTEFEAIRAMF